MKRRGSRSRRYIRKKRQSPPYLKSKRRRQKGGIIPIVPIIGSLLGSLFT